MICPPHIQLIFVFFCRDKVWLCWPGWGFFCCYFFVLRHLRLESHRLEWSSTISAHCNLDCLGSSDPATSASWVDRTTGTCNHAWPLGEIFSQYFLLYLIQKLNVRDLLDLSYQACFFENKLVLFILRQGLTLSPRLVYSGTVMAHCSFDLLGSSDPPASASCITGTTGLPHHAWLIFF